MGKEGRATFIKALKNTDQFGKRWEHTDLLYEYRGYQYIVTKHNNGYAFDPLWKQHRKAQSDIDYKIEHADDPVPEWKYEGSAQEGFDMAWEYFEGEEN